MEQYSLNLLFVGATFLLYIGIAIWARAGSTSEFYAAGRGVHPVLNGMATAADWMSAASFISMAGLIAFTGYDNSSFLMGWTGGYVLLALLLAPYLRKFGKFTVPEFIGDRFYSPTARMVAVACLIIASITYVIGQMTGVGVAFSRFLEVDNDTGLFIGAAIVFFYAVLGGMKGVTYTQVAQYCVLILAYTIPAIFISLQLTGVALPPIGLFADHAASGIPLLTKLNQVVTELGFSSYTEHHSNTLNMVLVHLVSDDWYRWITTCHHSLLYRSQSLGRTLVCWLGSGIHRLAVPDGSGCGCHGTHEPDGYHLSGWRTVRISEI